MQLSRSLSDSCNSAGKLISRWDGKPAVSGRSSHATPGSHRQVQNRLTEPQIAELVAIYEAGANLLEIAERFRINRATVSVHLHRSGVGTRYRRLLPDQIKEAATLYAEGWSLARLGERFKVSDSTVLNAFRKDGFQTRPRPGKNSNQEWY